jgi:hypothetical protein
MTSDEVFRSVSSLLREIAHGASPAGAFVLNPGDPGLLAALDRLPAAPASRSVPGGATVAAHVAHVSYGLSLLGRWADGEENPWQNADWSQAWRVSAVSDAEWAALRHELRQLVDRWLEVLGRPREISGVALDGVVASVVHLAYHLGAIRQIEPAARGPREGSPAGPVEKARRTRQAEFPQRARK